MKNLFESRSIRQAATAIGIIGITVLLLMMCQPAGAQERATLVSSEKIKFSTYYSVTVKTDSCNEYNLKWNSHCFRCTESEVPKVWDIVKVKNRYFIKPVI